MRKHAGLFPLKKAGIMKAIMQKIANAERELSEFKNKHAALLGRYRDLELALRAAKNPQGFFLCQSCEGYFPLELKDFLPTSCGCGEEWGCPDCRVTRRAAIDEGERWQCDSCAR
jgi:hypothetical protein